jgi:hypothetical protein
MGQANGQTTKGEQMQCGDQRQRVNVQGWSLFGLHALVGWWWDACLFGNYRRHHKADLLDEGASLVRTQLTLLCQILAFCGTIAQELVGGYETPSAIINSKVSG